MWHTPIQFGPVSAVLPRRGRNNSPVDSWDHGEMRVGADYFLGYRSSGDLLVTIVTRLVTIVTRLVTIVTRLVTIVTRLVTIVTRLVTGNLVILIPDY